MDSPEIARALIFLFGAITLSTPAFMRALPPLLEKCVPLVERMASAIENASRAAFAYWKVRNADVAKLRAEFEALKVEHAACEARAARLRLEFEAFLLKDTQHSRPF